MPEITRILEGIPRGTHTAGELLPLVYAELRRLAGRQMDGERPDQTLQPTALVHEAYLRLVGEGDAAWDGRGHFFAAAAEAMRRILIENARRRNSLKRGRGVRPRPLEEADGWTTTEDPGQLLDLDAALTKLAEEEPDLARLVELRYFAGLSVEDAGRVLGVSPRTVKRSWAYARAWLGRELHREPEP